MPEPKFILKEAKSKNESLIYLMVRGNYLRLKYSTGEKIYPDYWNKETQRAITTESEAKKLNLKLKFDKSISNKLTGINTQLNRYKEKVEQINSNCRLNRKEFEPGFYKNELDKEFKVLRPAKSDDLFFYIENFIKQTENGERLTEKKTKFSNVTVKGYGTTLFHLQEFKKTSNRKFTLDSVDNGFYDDFVMYFNKADKALNTIGKNIKNLKVFLNQAYREGLITNIKWQSKHFKTVEEETDQVYLSDKEIQSIYKYDFSFKPTLEKVKDLFVISCYTGLRYSDLPKVTKENIISDGKILQVKTQKTGEIVSIPLHWVVSEILAKYNYKLPGILSNQKMNSLIKDVCEGAGINEKIRATKTIAGTRKDDYYEKYKLCTIHTGRRSFATNMFLAGIPVLSIRKITGHRTEKAFMKYIRVSDLDNAEMLLNHEYFKKIIQKKKTVKVKPKL